MHYEPSKRCSYLLKVFSRSPSPHWLHADKLEDVDSTNFKRGLCSHWHDNLRDFEESYLNVIKGVPQSKLMSLKI